HMRRQRRPRVGVPRRSTGLRASITITNESPPHREKRTAVRPRVMAFGQRAHGSPPALRGCPLVPVLPPPSYAPCRLHSAIARKARVGHHRSVLANLADVTVPLA